MPGLSLQTEAFVLLKRPPSDRFQGCTVFSPEHGHLQVMQRVAQKTAATQATLDLFDEVALILESSNQGQTWFVKETRLLHRPTGIGRSYEALRQASAFAALIARNRVAEEGRVAVGRLLQQAIAAFATSDRPDLVYFKALYAFARDEGYPVRQQWRPTLPADLRATSDLALRTPLQALAPADVPAARTTLLIRRLEEYLRGHTEVLIE
ncbi:MAG: hypothetical protein KF897_14055 [Opitutaceae bacterium]|nr:hypothetical protein [Opitutaceae bacterium]